MIGVLWVLVAIFAIAWLVGLGGLVHLAAGLIWLFLIVALVLAVASLIAGNGAFGRRT